MGASSRTLWSSDIEPSHLKLQGSGEGHMGACVPTNYADDPKSKGVINITHERINVQNIPDHVNHCMEPNKIEFNDAKSGDFKFKGQV